MARKSQAALLDMGDVFPQLDLTLTSGERLSLPEELSKPFNVLLVNRGSWCPFCVGQLAAFQAGLVTLTDEGIGVVSISAESREKAAKPWRTRASDSQLLMGPRSRGRRRRWACITTPPRRTQRPIFSRQGSCSTLIGES